MDDREDNLASMEIVLEREGYAFSKALSGRDALKILLKEDDFSLILLDVKMPIMDGYETAELIYQREKLRHIPIIFITAHDYEEDAIFKGYKTGAVDYIRKPFKPQVLRAKVGVFAELHKKNQLLRQQEEKLRVINNELRQFNQELEIRVQERTNELKQLNDQLKELNYSKDKFLSVISHDLRNPLTALIASSVKLNKDAEKYGIKEIRQLSDIIYRTSNRVLSQLNELVDWAKTQRQKTTFKPVTIQLLAEMDEWLELLKNNAAQKEISLKNNIPGDIMVNADTLMLRSILQNLVTNAIKYTPEGGTVSLSARQVGNMVEICVEDTGIGVSEEIREKLFTRTSSVSGTNNEQGSGLGLLLVKDFIIQHGGAITVETEVGKGTCFRFTVPGIENETAERLVNSTANANEI